MADVATTLTNDTIATHLRQVAELLESHGANPFRVKAYRDAAQTVAQLAEPLAQLYARGGLEGLVRLPTIGKSLAHSLEHFIRTGRLPLLSRLQGRNVAERLFESVPTIGRKLGHRIHDELGIETLADLRAAALDGRLALVAGMGEKRLQAVREALAGRFRSSAAADRPPLQLPADTSIPVSELLDIDREYRQAAKRGGLPRIAPRKFNPTMEAWLPVLHTHRGQRHYTAMFSNSARAHEMGATRDWVVIYRDDPDGDGRWTVITAAFGPLAGQRVVAGRETECAAQASGSALAGPAGGTTPTNNSIAHGNRYD